MFYYEKVTGLDHYNGSDLGRNYKAVAIRNNLRRKLATIYFNGKGVKKNFEKSYFLALDGKANITELFDFYSHRYFGRTSIILDIRKVDFEGIVVYTIIINPFSYQLKGFNKIREISKVRVIAKSFKRKTNIENLNMEILTYCETSSLAQTKAYQTIDVIRDYFIKVIKIFPDRIYTNIEVGAGESHTAYKGLSVPYVEIRFTKK